MQEKENVMFVRCELKIPSLEKPVRHHSASLVLSNSYPSNPRRKTFKDSYVLMFTLDAMFMPFSTKCFDVNVLDRNQTELFLVEKCRYFSIIFMSVSAKCFDVNV